MPQLKLQPSGPATFPSDQMGLPQITQSPFNPLLGLGPTQSGGLLDANDLIMGNNMGQAPSPLVMKREGSISQFFAPPMKDEHQLPIST
jgi:hypothetical protein